MKPFTTIAAGVFALVAVVHLLRIVFGWPVLINGMAVPIWASGVGFVISAALAVMLWRERRIA